MFHGEFIKSPEARDFGLTQTVMDMLLQVITAERFRQTQFLRFNSRDFWDLRYPARLRLAQYIGCLAELHACPRYPTRIDKRQTGELMPRCTKVQAIFGCVQSPKRGITDE